MKEATGELNMTVITVVAIAAVAGIFYAFVWPGIQTAIKRNTCKTQCPGTGGKEIDETCMSNCVNKTEYLDNDN